MRTAMLYEDPDPLGLSLPEDDRSYVLSWNDWSAAVAEQRHLLQAQYTDSHARSDHGRRCVSADVYDDSLVIVTCRPRGNVRAATDAREPVPRTLDDILYAPLFVSCPTRTRDESTTATSWRSTWCRRSPTCSRPRADVGAPTAQRLRFAGDLAARSHEALVRHPRALLPSARRRRRVRRRRRRSRAPPTVGSGRWTDPDDPLAALDELLDIRRHDRFGTQRTPVATTS